MPDGVWLLFIRVLLENQGKRKSGESQFQSLRISNKAKSSSEVRQSPLKKQLILSTPKCQVVVQTELLFRKCHVLDPLIQCQEPPTPSLYVDEVCIESGSRSSFTLRLLAGAPHSQRKDQHVDWQGSSRLTYCVHHYCSLIQGWPCKDSKGKKESCSLCKSLSLRSHYASSGI